MVHVAERQVALVAKWPVAVGSDAEGGTLVLLVASATPGTPEALGTPWAPAALAALVALVVPVTSVKL